MSSTEKEAQENNFAADDQPELPSSVTRIQLDGKEIFLIATAHVSAQSVEDVRRTIERVEPDSVCVELCQARYQNLINREQWKKTDVVKVVRERKAALLLTSLIMTSFQKRIGKKLGVTPGAEMLEAIHQAETAGRQLILADRDIQITLKRTWSHLNLREKLNMIGQLVGGLFLVEEIDEQMVEEIKKEENLADILQILAERFPAVKGTLIDERDIYLAQKIRQAEGPRVVAVVGAGHVPGTTRQLEFDTPLSPLLQLPRPSLFPQLLKWGIPALIVGLFIYGFFKGGAQHSLDSVYIWILVNGALSALGAALALGHPASILAAFVAAPLTSLNPMIAAGWVSGLVQAFVKKPRVEDLENLPEAITSVAGFWRNPVSRILLVVVLSNLGSTLGTFISGSWIAARSLG